MIRQLREAGAETLALTSYGVATGIYRYYVRPELTAKRAWLGLASGVILYDLLAPKGQMLSEGADNALEIHPWATRAAIGITALHLANVIPESIDPFKLAIDFVRR